METEGLSLEQTPIDPAKLQGAAIETRALTGILGLVNSAEFSENPDGPGGFGMAPPEVVPSPVQQKTVNRVIPRPAAPGRALIAPPAAPKVTPMAPMADRIYTTGRLRAGKDHVLTALGYTIHGFADPLYAVQEFFFGTRDKSAPGARKFLQMLGQWGRGVVNEQYPLTAARAVFTTMIRSMASQLPNPEVAWDTFGASEDIWVNALLKRIKVAEGKIAVSNCRFENEYKLLAAAGLKHYHVMCSRDTWTKRLQKTGLTPQSPEVNDYSERFAAALDADALQNIKLKPNGGKLRVIWNDPGVRSPSPRFITMAELGL